MPTTVATGIRVPRMHGTPPMIRWSMEIRSKATTKGYARQSSQARRWRTTKASRRRGRDRSIASAADRKSRGSPHHRRRLTATSHQLADPSALLAHVVEPLAL
jgi:hypothetical protein